ncbi:MAG: sialate O-acetylesterase [Akkermansiaceae bacterium]|jgi:hypothetical protein|tara:strand:+ start:1847 stop:2878 length:1032 start_codon:yes stop_codon:yes gene_type:complete
MKTNKLSKTSCLLAAMSMGITGLATAEQLPDPDGKPADMSKPVQVFLIMGQSNTLEMGKVSPELGKAYPFLADDAGAWTTRKDVRNVSVMVGRKGIYRNDWMTISGGKIGIEVGVGHQLGNAIDAPVMILKSSIGNRSLGWDLLPPGTPRYSHDGKECPGYKETVQSKKDSTIVPYVQGGDMLQWYAGKQYDDDVANAKKILADLDKYYPGAKSYEVAGIVWWQGDKDMRNAAHAAEYEKNLGRLLKALRKDFNAPKAAFVCASLGQTDESDTTSGHGKLMTAMKNFTGGKYSKEHGANLGFVYSKPLLDAPSSSSGHYGGNGKTYMNVGLALGEEMVKQLKK